MGRYDDMASIFLCLFVCPREIDDPSEKLAYLVEDSRKSSVPVRSDHTDSKGPTSVWE